VLIDIAQRDDIDRRDLDEAEQIGLAIPTASDQSHAFPLIGKIDCETPKGGSREGRGAGLEELTAIHPERIAEPPPEIQPGREGIGNETAPLSKDRWIEAGPNGAA